MSRPSAVSGRRAHPFFWIALLLGVFSLGLYLGSGLLIYRHGGSLKDFGWEAACEGGACVVRSVRPGGPAAGRLAAGDRILAVRGDARIRTGLWLHLHPIPADTSYSVRIARGPSERELVLAARLRRDPTQLARIYALLPVGLTFLAAGLVVGTRRPDQAAARLVSLACLAASLNLLQLVLLGFSDQLRGLENAVWALAGLFRPFERVLGYHFLLHFPPGLTHGRGWKVLLRALYAWAALLWAWITLVGFLILMDPTLAIAAASGLRVLGALGDTSPPARAPVAESALGLPFFFVANAAIPALALWSYRLVRKPDQLRRIRWVLFGVVGAFLPVATLDLAAFLARSLEHPEVLDGATFRLFGFLAVWASVLVPVSLTYAVLKHGLLDVDLVIRRGLKYLLARNVLRLALLLPGAVLAVWIVSHPDRTLFDIVFEHPGHVFLIAAAGLSLRFRTSLTAWLDRRFFRATYDREQLLLGLIEEIKTRESIPEISRLACERLGAALHPESLHFFYRPPAQRHLEAGYSSDGQWPSARIPETSDLLRVMDGQVMAKDYPFTRIDLAADEATWLEQLGVSLVVPIPAPDRRLAGLLLLGAKKSEEPFGSTDRRMLEVVAAQIGIVWDNAVLRERVDQQQRVQHEVLKHLDERQMNLVRECPLCRACYDRSAGTCPADGAELVLSLPVERTIDSRYRLDRLIGRGGMGAVYEATDLRLARRVALKVLTGSLFGNRVALRRFEREARAVAQLSHPAIITVHDYGELSHGGAYLVMELLPGATLRRAIEVRETIPPPPRRGMVRRGLRGRQGGPCRGHHPSGPETRERADRRG